MKDKLTLKDTKAKISEKTGPYRDSYLRIRTRS